MAYRLDFTAANYVRRSRRKGLLRLLLLAAVAGTAWEINDAYVTYKQPTLNMRLSEYESVTRPIEEINAVWDDTAREYAAMVRYYRLLWSSSPTNFLCAMVSADAPRLGRRFHPLTWQLATGGKCQLDYRYVFDPGDKAEQARSITPELVNAVTSVVTVADGRVEVSGVRSTELLRVENLNLSVRFSLPGAKAFPTKDKELVNCVDEIGAMRRKVLDARLREGSAAKGAPNSARGIMMEYLTLGKDRPGFPELTKSLSVADWFDRADQFIVRNRIPGDEKARLKLKAEWNEIGNARFPWQRFRLLDNDELSGRTKALMTVSDGMRRFRGFLQKRHTDCSAKLEPFVEAYGHDDVFNQPFIRSDLEDRVAAVTGVAPVNIAFRDEPGAAPAVLVKDGEKFTFSWVRWQLDVGNRIGREAEKALAEGGGRAVTEPVTLERLSNCIRRLLTLGPGYALDSVKIDFGPEGNVAGATLTGLLPVKRVEPVKETANHVH